MANCAGVEKSALPLTRSVSTYDSWASCSHRPSAAQSRASGHQRNGRAEDGFRRIHVVQPVTSRIVIHPPLAAHSPHTTEAGII